MRPVAEVPSVTLVVAAAENGVIGNANRLPWHLPADLRHFKEITWGKPLLMGRRTFESIGRALPGRRSLVLTRDPRFAAPGIEVMRSREEALRASAGDELMVIGGADVFRLMLSDARRMHFTRVHATVPGDARLPALDWNAWHCISRATHPADEKNVYAMSFFVLETADDGDARGRIAPDGPG
jgi:dihydrofolate reductase